MISRLILIIYLIFGQINFAHSNEVNCDELKKFSSEYMKCKANLIKKKTISAGKNFVEDTKDFQEKEWSEGKKKVNKIKKKVLEQ